MKVIGSKGRNVQTLSITNVDSVWTFKGSESVNVILICSDMIGCSQVWEPSVVSCRTWTKYSWIGDHSTRKTCLLLRLRLLKLLRELHLLWHHSQQVGRIGETVRLISSIVLQCWHEWILKIWSLKSLKISRHLRLIILIITMIAIQGWMSKLVADLTLHIGKPTATTAASTTIVPTAATTSKAAKPKVRVVVQVCIFRSNICLSRGGRLLLRLWGRDFDQI